MTIDTLRDAIEGLLDDDRSLPEGWLVVFLHPGECPLDEAAARLRLAHRPAPP